MNFRSIAFNLVTLCLFLLPVQSLAESEAGAAVPASQISIEDKDDFQRLALVPVLGYTEETKFEYGAMANIFFKPSFQGGTTSELDLIGYGTSEDQYSISISPLLFLFHDHVYTKAYVLYEDWCSRFYGIGNDPDIDDYRKFSRKTFYTYGTLETNFLLPDNLSAIRYGLNYDIKRSSMKFEEYEGAIGQPKNVNGWRNRIGYHLNYDTRDNRNWARHGYFIQWTQDFAPDAISDFTFGTQELDVRGYSEFIWNTSMAVGFLWQRVSGDAPFDALAGPDGTRRFRGVKTNYFSGNQAMFLQTEFRKELFWRLAGTIFFEGGKAGDYFSDLARNKWHTDLGFGGQLALNKSEKLYARADFSWIDFKHFGLTFFIREAF